MARAPSSRIESVGVGGCNAEVRDLCGEVDRLAHRPEHVRRREEAWRAAWWATPEGSESPWWCRGSEAHSNTGSSFQWRPS